ncbi:hypothetical protein DAPPUDRAFT_319000 [Daphnia pulex]|uniref:Uncharacterized protein n=1 Tax=Daphnia pulex TaxID=6669 RepID=E9GKD8_DAPPU|nr:hypothetical protein DAPPUDRAFT_319000 [Daphnia pulex]|eukprot:EFX79976.1 hypothetical protein DAPPUDRAFT_319000 [Daphnia pulex]
MLYGHKKKKIASVAGLGSFEIQGKENEEDYLTDDNHFDEEAEDFEETDFLNWSDGETDILNWSD